MDVMTACTMDCPDACSLVVTVDGDRVVRMRGNSSHPVTAGFTCKKIKKHLKRLQSKERIVHPLLRDGSRWRPMVLTSSKPLTA